MKLRTDTWRNSTRQSKDDAQRARSAITAICSSALLSFAILLSLFSRPLADEHVQLGLTIGFLDDSLGSYEYSGASSVLRFVGAMVFQVQNGWDSASNSLLFQISPAYLNAISHGLGSSLLAVIVTVSWYAFCFVFLGDNSLNRKLLAALLLTTGLTIALRLAPFGVAFDIFPLTGVRFSLYFFHATLLFYWVERHVIGSSSERQNLITSVVLLMAWSMWFSMIWVLLSTLRVAIPIIKRQFRAARNRFATLVLGLILILVNNWFFIGLFERISVGASSQRSRGFFSDINWVQSAVDIISLAFGPQFLVGAVFGVLISYISIAKPAKRLGGVEPLSEQRSSSHTILVYIAFIVGIALVFQLQELITYRAYWHRTFPIVVSFLGGVRVMTLILARRRFGIPETRYGMLGRLAVAIIMSFLLVTSTSVLRSHARDYDAGNITSAGWAVGNTQDWVLPTLLRIGPDRLPNWIPPHTLLTEVDLVVRGTPTAPDGGPVVMDSDEVNSGGKILTLASSLTVIALPTRYSEELGGSIEVVINFKSRSAVTLTVIYQTGKRSSLQISPGDTPKSIDVSLPGEFSIVCVSGKSCRDLYVTEIDVDFSNSFKRKWSR